MKECQPSDLQLLDEYQLQAIDRVVYDDTGMTILGYAPEAYMYLGLLEEMRESYQPAERLQTLMGDVDKAAVTELAYHREEFGDMSWYIANLLHTYKIGMGEAASTGMTAWEEDAAGQPKSNPEFHDEVEQRFPFFFFAGYMHELGEAAKSAIVYETEAEIDQLRAAAGKFVLSLAHIARSRLDIDYADILTANITKIDKRTAEGTVLDKAART